MTPRVAKLRPEQLDPEQRRVYDAVAGGRRAQGPQLFRLVDGDGALEGPFNAMLLQPRLGLALQELGGAIRYGTALPDRAREIAILVVAVRRDCAFEWYAHEAIGRHCGLSDAELGALRERRYGTFADETERVVARTTQALLDTGDLDDAAYGVVVEALGEPSVFELITLVGYYDALATQLRVFRVAPPDLDSAADPRNH